MKLSIINIKLLSGVIFLASPTMASTLQAADDAITAPPEAVDTLNEFNEVLKRNFAKADQISTPQSRPSKETKAAYLSLKLALSEENLKKTSSSNLENLYEAAYAAGFYTTEDMYLQEMREILEEIDARDIEKPIYLIDLYKNLVLSRNFEESVELARKHPKIKFPQLPEIDEESISPHSLSILKIAPNSARLVHSGIEFKDLQIIVVASSECEYSINFARSVESSSQLRDTLSDAIWIAPVYEVIRYSSWRQWNANFPQNQLVTAYNNEDWNFLSGWATPAVYILKDGVVKAHYSGWPKDHETEAAFASRLKKNLEAFAE